MSDACECDGQAEDDRYCPIHGDDVDDFEEDDLDPCNYCPHDNSRHRGDGCLDCGCVVPQ